MMDPSNDAVERTIATSAQARVSLPIALRAAARETHRPTARHLSRLATRLELGMDLEAALDELGKSESAPFAALIRAGTRAGDLGCVLAEMSNFSAARRKMRAEWLLALAYPTVMLLVTLLFATLIFWTIVPTMEMTLRDFEINLPALLQLMLSLGRNLVTLLWTLLASMGVCLVLTRMVLGRVRFWWFITTVPLLGPPVFWTGTWEWLVMLRQLVMRGIPLPESLSLVAASLSAPNIAAASRKLAARIEAGESLEQVLHNTAFLPASIAPLLGWGETQQALVESLQLAGDAMAERVRLRLTWLSMVLPPVLFVLIATLVGCVVTSCLFPLVVLIQNLS